MFLEHNIALHSTLYIVHNSVVHQAETKILFFLKSQLTNKKVANFR